MILLLYGVSSSPPKALLCLSVERVKMGLECIMHTFSLNTVKTCWQGELNFWCQHTTLFASTSWLTEWSKSSLGQGGSVPLSSNTGSPPQKKAAVAASLVLQEHFRLIQQNLSRLPKYFVLTSGSLNFQIAIKCSLTDLYLFCWPKTWREKYIFILSIVCIVFFFLCKCSTINKY